MNADGTKVRRPPQRTCIGCRRKGDAGLFYRVARNTGGELELREAATAVGRSAYVCKSEDCIRAATEKERLSRALKRPITKEELVRLRDQLLCKQR